MTEEKNKIEISTRDFGMKSISQDDVITFPKGLFAFEEVKNFVILSPLGEDASPMWLQNTEGEKPCFIVFRPMEFIKEYKPLPLEEDLMTIGYEQGDKLQYYSIAVIPEDYKKTTINLRSPVIINETKKLGVQAILPQNYDMRFRIYQGTEG